MDSEEAVITEVPDKSVPLNNARIKEDASSKYPYFFWGAYKHHVPGLLTGIIAGAAIGAVIGLPLIFFMGPIGLLAGAGAGLVFGAAQGGAIGTASGSRAAGLAMRHASAIDPANQGDPEKIANDQLMHDSGNHHYEYPKNRDDNKYFSWKSGLVGMFIGGGAGALIGHITAAAPVVAKIALITGITGVAGPIVAGALVFGMLGASFGIERGLFKTVFNWISTLTEGKRSPEAARPEPGVQLTARQLQRQEDIYDLRTKYEDKIFKGSVRGYLKGALGGAGIGAFFGAVAGLVAIGILAIAGAPVLASIAAVVGLFAGAGAIFGLYTFGGTGYEAGAESTARAIDDEFQVEQSRKAKGLPVPAKSPEEPQKGPVASLVDKLMHGVGKVSGGSKKVYNSVYDPEVPIHPDIAAHMLRPPKQDYAVTAEEAATLGQRLNNSDKKNFADIIAQPQTQPIPPL